VKKPLIASLILILGGFGPIKSASCDSPPPVYPPYICTGDSCQNLSVAPADPEDEQSQEPAPPPVAAVMIELDGEVNADSVAPIIAKLKELDAAGTKEVWFRINSNGGSVMAGQDLIVAIESMRAHTTCVADWHAFSMGFSLLEACQDRVAVPQAMMMVHLPSIHAEGNENDIGKQVELLKSIRKIMTTQLLARLKITRAQLDAHFEHGSWWMDSAEALKIGAIDRIVQTRDLPAVTPIPTQERNLLQILGLKP